MFCHSFFIFNVTEGKLNCHLTQRSGDIALGIPFNLACYAMLTQMIAQETNLEIDVKHPLNIKHFTRADGQTITMICFECYSANKDVKLSEEHIDFGWFALEEAKEKITPFLKNEVETLIS